MISPFIRMCPKNTIVRKGRNVDAVSEPLLADPGAPTEPPIDLRTDVLEFHWSKDLGISLVFFKVKYVN